MAKWEASMVKRILFVDDEQQILRALKRLFVSEGYEVHMAEGAKEAMELLVDTPVDLVVTDIRMPEIDGFELLKHVRSNYPLTLRVALSGYSDSKKIFSALDDSLAKLYVMKPWDNNELLDTIRKLFELEDSFKDKNLLNLINNLSELPTVPTLYSDICRLIEQDASVMEISNRIEDDQSISSRILRVANSSFYGAKTGSIAQAIMYIGLANVKNIVLTNGIFSYSHLKDENLDLIWAHVRLTNKLMTLIYQRCLNKKVPNSYASAGLLHEIGRVVVINHFNELHHRIMDMAERDKTKSLVELEEQVMKISHQQIGGYLLNWWEIPVPIVESALYHHDPLNSKVIYKELVCVVHIANHYSSIKLEMEALMGPLNLSALDYLGIDQSQLETIVEEVSTADLN